MADIVSGEKRSQMMSGIKSKNTKPELLIRKGLFKRKFRYRIHCKNLPGSPDIVLKKYNAVIFINGCFWHGHDCSLFKMPSTRINFWNNKIIANKERDERSFSLLRKDSWRILVIWECAIKGRGRMELESLIDKVAAWLRDGSATEEIREKL